MLLVASLRLVSGPTSKPDKSAPTRHFDSASWDQLLEGDDIVCCGNGNGALVRLQPDGDDSVDPALNLQDNDQLYLLDYDSDKGLGMDRAAVLLRIGSGLALAVALCLGHVPSGSQYLQVALRTHYAFVLHGCSCGDERKARTVFACVLSRAIPSDVRLEATVH